MSLVTVREFAAGNDAAAQKKDRDDCFKYQYTNDARSGAVCREPFTGKNRAVTGALSDGRNRRVSAPAQNVSNARPRFVAILRVLRTGVRGLARPHEP